MTKYFAHSCVKVSLYMCIHTSSQRINSTLPGIMETQPLLPPCVILPHEFGFSPILILQSQMIYVFSIPTLDNLYCVQKSGQKCKNRWLETETATLQKLDNTSITMSNLHYEGNNTGKTQITTLRLKLTLVVRSSIKSRSLIYRLQFHYL